jgi:CheY-like chemotaxis protein
MGDLLARSIGAHIRVETRLHPELWRALADPTQLEMMILNLAINARDAMPAGGRLTIETRNVAPVPAALAGELSAGEYVAISVADTGVAMPPEVLARAFESFFTTKAQGKGTGLGLAQLYGFAKQSGGTARIESEPGQGTSVTIYLPRTRVEALDAPAQLPERRQTRTARILVVDDDDDVRTVATAIIEELGYEVDSAAGGEAALTALRTGGYQLLITDLAMPGMNGLDLARHARSVAPQTPVLFASGYADVQTFGDELTEELVLEKPYRVAEMAARVEEALRASAASGTVVKFRR